MRPAPSKTLSVYKGKAFVRFARKAHITDADLWQADQRANNGLIDADLGGGVIKQRIAREGKESLADGGYSGRPFAEAVSERLGASVQIAKRSELHTFAVMPQRWVVERSFAWLEKCRRLWKNCERKLNTSLQMVHLAFLALLLRRS